MIRAVDEALRLLVTRELAAVRPRLPRILFSPDQIAADPGTSSGGIASAPIATPANAAGVWGHHQTTALERSDDSDAVCLFLFDVRENTRQRETGRLVNKRVSEHSAEISRPPVWMDLCYAVFVQATNPAAEHALLADVLQALLRHPSLDLREILDPDTELGQAVRRMHAPQPLQLHAASTEVLPDPIRFWQALGQRLRGVFPLVVTTAMEPHTPQEAPLVSSAVVALTDSATRRPTPRTLHWVAIAGTVTAVLGGNAQPLPGARLECLREGVWTSTNDAGFFYFLNLKPASYLVRASAEGHTATMQEVEVRSELGERYATAEFQLRRAVVSGTVLRPGGMEPLPGALVISGIAQATTDVAGYYAFEDLPAGPLTLQVSAAGYLPQEAPVLVPPGDHPRPQRADFRLERAALSGEVLDRSSRAPVAGARISFPGNPDLVADRMGRFSLARIPDGRYRIRASADGYEPGEQHLDIQTSRRRSETGAFLRFELDRPADGVAADSSRRVPRSRERTQEAR